jgi:tetratricopeptide (TPR) repeat protein
LTNPNNDLQNISPGYRRILRGLVVVLVACPVLFLWRWQFDRWRTDRAISRALRAGEKALSGGEAVKAIIAFNHARELRPSDPELQKAVWRARALLIAESSDRVSAENMEDVRYEMEQLIDAGDPEMATYLTALAHVYQRRGDAASAMAKLNDAIETNPRSVVAHLALAELLQKTTERIDDATREYQAVLAVDPRNFTAHFGLSRMYLLKKDPNKELEELKAATAVRDSYDAWNALGDAYLHVQKLPEARAAYVHAAALSPNSPEPHWGIGTILFFNGEWAAAERELRLAMAGKHYAAMSFQLGTALARQHKCAEATPLLVEYARENPKHGGVQIELGMCAAELGQRDHAIAFFQQVLQMPLPPEGDARRGDAEKRHGQAAQMLAKLGVKSK